MKNFLSLLFLACILSLSITSCDPENSTPNLFTLSDDAAFGMQMKDEMLSNPSEFPILDPIAYPKAYDYMERIKGELIASGEVAYVDQFPWEIYIIDKDIVNAFATPGGYLYFFTGLIEELENEAQLTGVLAHEMAHCARRHSTNQMTKAYGLQLLISIVIGGNPTQLAAIAGELANGLATLAFSRNHEHEADEYAVRYISNGTGGQDPRAMGDFFAILKKLEGDVARQPVFLSTHPDPEDRQEKILEHWNTYSGKDGQYYEERFTDFKQALGISH